MDKANLQNKKINQGIDELQATLVPLVQEMFRSGEICFTSDFYQATESGHNWILKEKIPGNFLVESYEKNPERYFQISQKIAQDYQKVIRRYFEKYEQSTEDLLESGKRKLFGNFFKWSGLIVEAGLLQHEEVLILAEEFEKLIAKKGADFFGYTHGNVIGDHVFVANQNEQETFYLLGMRFTPSPVPDCYDFLRSLDWIFLKSFSDEKNFQAIVGNLKKCSAEFGQAEISLIFALRAIGILGWDMLQRGDWGVGDKDEKIKYLLKFIRREW